MTIKTETTVTFHYPEERDAETSFTHDNDMSEWVQVITNKTVSYKGIRIYQVQLGKRSGEQDA